MKRDVDIVIISDVHLGTYGSHARELLNYLKSIRPGTLILNGDFIDMWQFRKKYFPKDHMQVIHQVLKLALSGTKVYYITGNHDDMLRRFSDFSTGTFNLRDQLIIQLRGEKYWIFHGDIFDASLNYSKWIAKLGGKGYDWLILFNRVINKWRERLGMRRMSFATRIKRSMKKAVKYINNFEQCALKLAKEQGYDYVICGHIHKPQVRVEETAKGKVTYLNSGDWVENLTALEYQTGKWSLYEYNEADFEYVYQPGSSVDKQGSLAGQPEQEEALKDLPTPESLFQQLVQQSMKKRSAS